jgi:hypothetical protein
MSNCIQNAPVNPYIAFFLDVKGESLSLSCESLSMFQAEKRFPVVNKVEAVVNNLQEKQRISYNFRDNIR